MKTTGGVHTFPRLVAALAVALACTYSASAQMAIRMVAPTNGAVFISPVDISLVAEVRNVTTLMPRVEFFAGSTSLGIGSMINSGGTFGSLWGLVWSNVPPGRYTLTARVTNAGIPVTTLPVNISVQPVPQPPVVSIRATDPYASEPGRMTLGSAIDIGRFTISRSNGTNVDLRVGYSISGTASNGVDYVKLTNTVVIPQGNWSADILVQPLPDDLVEGTETVVLRLQPVAMTVWPPPYLVGQPAEATVFIQDFPATNRPPFVQLVQPPAGAVFPAFANIRLLADTVDPDGYVEKVEFFANSLKIGEQRKIFIVPPTNGTHIPYEMTWSNVAPGNYALTAQATDNGGGIGLSAPVRISVATNVPPPITNPLPVVTIVATDPVAIEGTNCWGWPSVTNRWPAGTTNCVTLAPNSSVLLWWFTNCGPKNATLTVRRAGNTNSDLLVSYAIGGTATNGVDYDLLPGVVTLSAGQRSADILIVPKEDQHPDPIKTVILKLILPPVANPLPPPYRIGYPNCAGAIIVDSDRPRVATAMLPGRTFHVGAEAPDGAWFRIEHSTDLANWVAVCTNQAIQGTIHFVDPEAQDAAQRFYRAVPEVNPPGQ